jgi:hypothetical protein
VAWLLVTGWIVYEVVLTRLSRSDNSWVIPTLVVLAALFLLTVAAAAAGSGERSVVRRHVVASLAVGLMLLGAVVWVVVAPLPQLRSVPLPPSTASPEQVVWPPSTHMIRPPFRRSAFGAPHPAHFSMSTPGWGSASLDPSLRGQVRRASMCL